jgi:hypothetical protein
MSLFEFTFALGAVILGLALTHLAATVHKLLLAGKRVQWAPEQVLLTIMVLLVIISVWLGSWSSRSEASVTFGQMLVEVAKVMTLYIAAASCLPEPAQSEPLDLQEYYDRTRLLSFGSLILSVLLFRIDYIVSNGMPSALTFGFALFILLYPVLYACLIFVRNRWFNVLTLGFLIIYFGWRVSGQQLTG